MTEKYKRAIRILVAEDDNTIAKMMEYNLRKEGYEVVVVNDGDHVIEKVKTIQPEVILLDWVLPGLHGIKICSILRENKDTANIPIIMISSKSEDFNKVSGLEHGADDYMTKPFSPSELSARIKAILRRIRPAFSEQQMKYGDIVLDANAYTVERNGNLLKISPIEFQILQILMESPKKVFSRNTLIARIWQESSDVDERTIDVHITRLRKVLIEHSADGSDVIKTIRLAGYKLD